MQRRDCGPGLLLVLWFRSSRRRESRSLGLAPECSSRLVSLRCLTSVERSRGRLCVLGLPASRPFTMWSLPEMSLRRTEAVGTQHMRYYYQLSCPEMLQMNPLTITFPLSPHRCSLQKRIYPQQLLEAPKRGGGPVEGSSKVRFFKNLNNSHIYIAESSVQSKHVWRCSQDTQEHTHRTRGHQR